MAYTEAGKRATIKYITEKRDKLGLNMPKGKKDEYRTQAAKRGLSLNAYIINLIEQDIAKGEQTSRIN